MSSYSFAHTNARSGYTDYSFVTANPVVYNGSWSSSRLDNSLLLNEEYVYFASAKFHVDDWITEIT